MKIEPKIKLIATDLDGTLLDKDEKVPEIFFKQIEQLNKLGIKVAIASGRQYDNIRNLFGDHTDLLYFIGDNGALGIHRDDVFHTSFLDWSIAFDLIKQAKTMTGIVPLISAKTHTYFEKGNKEDIDFITQFYKKCVILDSFDEIDTDSEPALKVAFYDKLGVKNNSLLHFTQVPNIKATQSNVKWLDIAPKQSHKGAAITTLQQRYNITTEETIAFGDYHNDIEMLKKANYSFAVATAQDDVKAVAKYETLSNMDLGVCHILQYLIDQSLASKALDFSQWIKKK